MASLLRMVKCLLDRLTTPDDARNGNGMGQDKTTSAYAETKANVGVRLPLMDGGEQREQLGRQAAPVARAHPTAY